MPPRTDRELIIRADASPGIGMGHLMRCLALAEAWSSSNGRAFFLTATESERLKDRIEREGYGIVEISRPHPDPRDLRTSAKVLADHPDAWAIADGYLFDEVYHRGLRAAGNPLLAVDDMARLSNYTVDALLNQNAHASLLSYTTLPDTKRLLGPAYVLLRSEFRERKQTGRAVPDLASHVLVTMGGADPGDATGRVVEALLQIRSPGLDATVVIGPENPRRGLIETRLRNAGARVEIADSVADMSALMASADLAIVTGGSSVWELAYLGVPALVLPTGPQEELLARGLIRERIGRVLGPAESVDPRRLAGEIQKALEDSTWREESSRRGQTLVDGKGADRVVEVLRKSGRVTGG